MTYFSVLMGAPVLKEGQTPSFDIPIKILRTEPEKLSEYLKGTSGEVLRGVPTHHLRPNDLKLHDLQARLYMRPDLMFDPQFTTVKSYWRFGTPDKAYYEQINGLVNQGLTKWLQKGAPAHPDAFDPKTAKLKGFVKMVYKGSTGLEAPSALERTIEQQFVDLLLEGGETAASMLDEHYNDLLNKTFVIHPDRNGRGGGQYSLTELIKSYQSLPIIKVAFQKGMFKGGDEAYQVILLIESGYDRFELLDHLSKFKKLLVSKFNL